MTEKCVLLSLHPKWWPQILSGHKTLEIRKTAPNVAEWPVRVIVYLTRPRCEIVGEFLCAGYIRSCMYGQMAGASGLGYWELEAYAGKPGAALCAWQIAEPRQYEKALKIKDLGLKSPPQSWRYIEQEEE